MEPIEVRPTLISLNQAAKYFPSSRNHGKCISVKVLYKWILRGVVVAGRAEKVKLKATKLGGHWYTTAKDVMEFINAAAEHHEPNDPIPLKDKAEQLLIAAGF
jgi:hypothetical protein